jgi:hypothetical protein
MQEKGKKSLTRIVVNMISKLPAFIQKIIATAPIPIGIAVGYMAHPLIKFVIDAVKACLG